MPSSPEQPAVSLHPAAATPAIIVFARLPEPGKVKTRLARATGDLLAAGVYRACAEHAFSQTLQLPATVRKFVFFADPADEQEIKRWVPAGFSCLPQSGADVGQRMANAAQSVLSTGASACVIVGTDAPDLSPAILQDAIAALDRVDVVLGPALDGGYYLIGMNRPRPELFTGISWGTSSVFASTLDAVKQANLTVGLLPALLDIDTGEDLDRWRSTSCAAAHPLHALLLPQ